MTTKVKDIVIEYRGNGNDGYPTKVLVDGQYLPQRNLPNYEKRVKVIARCKETVLVEVEFYHGETEVFEPENFAMEVGDLSVRTRPDRFPCEIKIAGYEPRCLSIEVEFAEGQMVMAKLEFKPHAVEPDVPEVR